MTVKITRTETRITVTSEYNKEFVARAHNLAGTFDSATKSWSFDIRDEADVLEACYYCYGEDGYRQHLCDAEIHLPNGYYIDRDTINFFGRPVARAFNRDSGAKIFDGVVIKTGGFGSGGSMKHWTTYAEKGTVIVLRDLSLPLVEMTRGKYGDDVVVEIINQNKSIIGQVDVADLNAEKTRLLARLAEIDNLLVGN